MAQNYDVIIIGAGIVGTMIARELSRYELSIALIDREADVGMGQSTSNSAIIHSGHDPEPGTLKARLNVRGNALWYQIAPEMGVPIHRTGAMIVATTPEQARQLEGLRLRGLQNGVEELRILTPEEAREREPLLTDSVHGALLTPSAGVVDPFQGVLAAGEIAALNGVHVQLNTEVTGFIQENDQILGVITNQGELRGTWVINAAGVHSDDLMHSAGLHEEFAISARRGEYFVFDQSALQVNTVLFPMPGAKGKGILVTPTTHGNTMVGPNSDLVADKEDNAVTRDGLHEILAGALQLIPSLQPKDVIATFAGLRATGNYLPDGQHRDFLIEPSRDPRGMLNLGGIESPGYAAAPAIAEYVVEVLRAEGLELRMRTSWTSTRRQIPRFKELTHDQRRDLVTENPAFGRIVCRCEEVTEGEILMAIRSPIPATTYDAIKRRTWLGTGRCQGSFDYPRTMEILARELNIPMTAVTKRGPGSVFLYRRTKEEVL